MDKKHREKLNALIKFLKREPKKGDLAPKRKSYLSFDSTDSYKKYCMLDKHIKLVVKCIDEGYIKSDYFFNSFERIDVRNYKDKLELFVLFPNSAKLVLFSPYKYERVGRRFFRNFNLTDKNGREVNLDKKDEFVIEYSPKESNARFLFDFVGD